MSTLHYTGGTTIPNPAGASAGATSRSQPRRAVAVRSVQQESLNLPGATPESLSLTIVRSRQRRRTLSIRVTPQGTVEVAVPWDTPTAEVHDLLTKRATWVRHHLSRVAHAPAPRQLVTGEELLYLGQPIPLVVGSTPARRGSVAHEEQQITVHLPEPNDGAEQRARVEAHLVRWFRAQATATITARAQVWSEASGLTPKAVLIREQRSRWGSCGADGTLRFNWRLVMAPVDLIDCVVVHELCHLKVPNHSSAFWSEVERHLPDHTTRRKRLHDLGPHLAL